MVIVCGRLGGRWFDSTGRFLFYFLANLLFWAAHTADFGGVEKNGCGRDLLTSRNWIPQRQKPRSWRGKPSVLRVPFGHSGALWGACGKI